eukprot:1377356-Amorphochlora_amoeboformis.AAC.1
MSINANTGNGMAADPNDERQPLNLTNRNYDPQQQALAQALALTLDFTLSYVGLCQIKAARSIAIASQTNPTLSKTDRYQLCRTRKARMIPSEGLGGAGEAGRGLREEGDRYLWEMEEASGRCFGCG